PRRRGGSRRARPHDEGVRAGAGEVEVDAPVPPLARSGWGLELALLARAQGQRGVEHADAVADELDVDEAVGAGHGVPGHGLATGPQVLPLGDVADPHVRPGLLVALDVG